jgi:SET domain-containing protein
MATHRRKHNEPSSRSGTRKKSRTKSSKPKARARRSPPGKPGPVNEWMELRGSPIDGLGAFARKEIPKGTRVIEYAGQRISNALLERRYGDETSDKHHTFIFILSSRTCIDAAYDGNEARFVNHSCDPNCETTMRGNRIWIETIKDIPAGVELAYDYMYDDEPSYTEKDLLHHMCRCGSATCRGTIVNTDRLKA